MRRKIHRRKKPSLTYFGALLCLLTAVAAIEAGIWFCASVSELCLHQEIRLPGDVVASAHDALQPLSPEPPPTSSLALPSPAPPERVEQPKPAAKPHPAPVYYDVPLSADLQDHIRQRCEDYGVPMALVLAMIEVESDFTPNLVSSTKDWGLMQINACNHEALRREFGITDFLDPYQNVECGIFILAGHLQATGGDIPLALMRYNCGAAGAKRRWEKGIYETDYTRKVMAAWERYEREETK